VGFISVSDGRNAVAVYCERGVFGVCGCKWAPDRGECVKYLPSKWETGTGRANRTSSGTERLGGSPPSGAQIARGERGGGGGVRAYAEPQRPG
jgi:hypothetical protein